MTQTPPSNKQPAAAPPAPNSQLKKFEEETVGHALKKISDFQTNGDIRLPANYSPENAVRFAWLIIQQTKDRNEKPVLEVCTKESIATALFDMVLKGLNPVKKQCYFIAYGDKLQVSQSYIGTVAIAKRVADVKNATANIIYEGDTFSYLIDKLGKKTVTDHQQAIDNIDMDKIKGAYATVEFNDGTTETEIMTIKQIRQAWQQGTMKGNSPGHKNFPDEISKKTVIQRALKLKIGSSDDSSLYDEDDFSEDSVVAGVTHEIKQNANKQAVGFNNPRETIQAPQPVAAAKEPVKVMQPVTDEAVESENGTSEKPPF